MLIRGVRFASFSVDPLAHADLLFCPYHGRHHTSKKSQDGLAVSSPNIEVVDACPGHPLHRGPFSLRALHVDFPSNRVPRFSKPPTRGQGCSINIGALFPPTPSPRFHGERYLLGIYGWYARQSAGRKREAHLYATRATSRLVQITCVLMPEAHQT